ncbi:MAG: QacE [Colwellia sp.]|uniref:DUF6232 family protein n=1 Tax=Colwellia sp. TaxID=56799 RepID=UPI0025C3AE0F|nr:DUF6232 family protein [Colwellia sp.]NQZ26364.1 QacE [Colwellia sp.]
MEEKIFLDAGNISVSNSRFIVDGQTYAIDNVTSVKTGVEQAKKGTGILIGLIGVFVLFSAKPFLWGLVILMFATLALIGARNKYSVVLSTSSGENQALTSEDKTQIEQVVSALNEAIVSRG